jgi:hypothetical protein
MYQYRWHVKKKLALTCAGRIIHEVGDARNARVIVPRHDVDAIWVRRALERRDYIADYGVLDDASGGSLEVARNLRTLRITHGM